MIKEAIKILTLGENLSQNMMRQAMSEIMGGIATPAQIAAFLTALNIKSESAQEISIAAEVMRERALVLKPDVDVLIDTCGTGGDRLHTFNISTLVALVISAYGIPVAKHGNRSVTSSCGSADLMEALGIPLNVKKDIVERAIKDINFGYIFAPFYHPAMKFAAPVRREIGIRTIFNILGPLANPAYPSYQILGVYAQELLEPVSEALKNLGLKAALVVHSRDGMDEISLSDFTDTRFLNKGEIKTLEINPSDFGLKKITLDKFRVNNMEESLKKAYKVLNGEDSPELDIVAFNTAWALFILNRVKNPQEGYQKAKDLIKEGLVLAKLEQIRNYFKNEPIE